MKMKICTKCKLEKDIELFVVKRKNEDGHASECKECHNLYNRKKYGEDIVLSRTRARKNTNEYYKRHPERHIASFKKYVQLHPDRRKETERTYRKNHPDKVKEWKKADRIRRKEKIREHDRIYRINNREKINERGRIRRNSTEQNKLKHNLRNRIRFVLKGLRRGGHLHELVGCSVDFLKGHLESLFTEGMYWSVYGDNGWHVDHIIPCDAFDLTDMVQQKACFYWKNLQPLWGKENISKKNNYNKEDFDKYMTWFRENIYK